MRRGIFARSMASGILEAVGIPARDPNPRFMNRDRDKENIMTDIMGRVTRRGAMGLLGTLGIGAIGTAVAPADPLCRS